VPDLHKIGSDWLQDRQKTWASRRVVYSRGAHQVELSATIGRTDFEIDSGDGFPIRTSTRDFLIHAADLVLDGVTVKPERHDRIQETDVDGSTILYEVMTPAENEPVWSYSDAYRRRLRVHTKKLEEKAE